MLIAKKEKYRKIRSRTEIFELQLNRIQSDADGQMETDCYDSLWTRVPDLDLVTIVLNI